MSTGGTSSPFHVPRSSFFVFHSRSLFPVLSFPFPVHRSPFPVLSFSNIPLKSTNFCHIWLGMALRASFLAANTKRFVVTSGHFSSSFPGSLFFPSSSFLGKGYCLERYPVNSPTCKLAYANSPTPTGELAYVGEFDQRHRRVCCL